MVGWCKLINENNDEIKIAYSLESNESCDGELIFNKHSKEIVVSRKTNGKYSYLTDAFMCPLRSRMRRKMEFGKKYMIMTG